MVGYGNYSSALIKIKIWQSNFHLQFESYLRSSINTLTSWAPVYLVHHRCQTCSSWTVRGSSVDKHYNITPEMHFNENCFSEIQKWEIFQRICSICIEMHWKNQRNQLATILWCDRSLRMTFYLWYLKYIFINTFVLKYILNYRLLLVIHCSIATVT